MNNEYNSRQRKIYSDYNGYSTDSLLEIIKKSDDYHQEIIKIINEILAERNVILPHDEPLNTVKRDWSSENTWKAEKEKQKKYDKYKSFVDGLSDKTENEISEIIRKYSSYQKEKVEAALYVAVDKGFISYDLKEMLLKQIIRNLDDKWDIKKNFDWEKDNAFKGFVSKYNDEEIYAFIEDPSDIVIDVYHAILVTARERELISEENLNELYMQVKSGLRSEEEIKKEENSDVFGTDTSVLFEDVADIEAEKLKYWKCPNCHELVGVEFDTCWNCQATMPENIERPDTAEIVDEKKSERIFSPSKLGTKLVVIGAVLIGISLIPNSHHHLWKYDYIDIAAGGLSFILGWVFIIFKPFSSLKRK
jgi:hypothetical protein